MQARKSRCLTEFSGCCHSLIEIPFAMATKISPSKMPSSLNVLYELTKVSRTHERKKSGEGPGGIFPLSRKVCKPWEIFCCWSIRIWAWEFNALIVIVMYIGVVSFPRNKNPSQNKPQPSKNKQNQNNNQNRNFILWGCLVLAEGSEGCGLGEQLQVGCHIGCLLVWVLFSGGFKGFKQIGS